MFDVYAAVDPIARFTRVPMPGVPGDSYAAKFYLAGSRPATFRCFGEKRLHGRALLLDGAKQ